eukprot:TRINITY_DN27896_c0_g1_i2.p1 TRINITY_DN27896_c0_g1~~TRINITY_DN27896_c0_g1_i2.p1  ORF type:complete len:2098 (+),score=402.90 TRINITY_DN27896_c0_g1_i2:199-6492(+)
MPVILGAYRTASPYGADVFGTSEKKVGERWETLPHGAVVQIEDAVCVQSDHRLRGRLESGGWISLVNTEDGSCWAEPWQVGVYLSISEVLQISIDVDPSSPETDTIAFGHYIQILETRYLPDQNCVRGRLAVGGWVSLDDLTTGACFATPVPLGAYRTSAAATDVFDGLLPSASTVLATLPQATPLEIVETMLLTKEQRLRGRLAGRGWISLQDTSSSYQWVEAVPPGTFMVTENLLMEKGGPTEGGSRHLKGDFLQVVQTMALADGCSIWGRLEGGGWCCLESQEGVQKDTPSKEYGQSLAAGCEAHHPWKSNVERVPLGAYQVTGDKLSVTEDLLGDGPPVRTLAAGHAVHVVESRSPKRHGHLRGRMATGGWIDLRHVKEDEQVLSQQACASPWKLGVHRVVQPLFSSGSSAMHTAEPSDSAVTHTSEDGALTETDATEAYSTQGSVVATATKGLSLSAGVLHTLTQDRIVQIAEAVVLEELQIARGRLVDGGWMTLEASEEGVRFTEPFQHTGTHRLLKPGLPVEGGSQDSRGEVPTYASADGDAPIVRFLSAGSVISVDRVVVDKSTEADWQVLGRMPAGDWVVLAMPARHMSRMILPGVYRMLAMETKVENSSKPGSGITKHLKAGELVQIQEVVKLPNTSCVRGRLSQRSWITIEEDTGVGWHQNAVAVLLGAYSVRHEEQVAIYVTPEQLPMEDCVESGLPLLPFGSRVYVAETRLISNFVWGRLEGGGWVVLEDVRTTYQLLEPLPVGAYTATTTTPSYAEAHLNAETLPGRTLIPGEHFEVVYVKISVPGSVQGTIWLCLAEGGWAPLDDGLHTRRALPCQLGAWQTCEEISEVSAASNLGSEALQPVSADNFVEIVHIIAAEGRLRGQSAYGGWWMTLEVSDPQRRPLARPLGLGAYCAKETIALYDKLPSRNNEASKQPSGVLKRTAIFEVIKACLLQNTSKTPTLANPWLRRSQVASGTDSQVWAQLDDHRWFLLENADHGDQESSPAEPVQAGVYMVMADYLNVRSVEGGGGRLVRTLLKDSYIDVTNIHLRKNTLHMQELGLEIDELLDESGTGSAHDVVNPSLQGEAALEMRRQQQHSSAWAQLACGGWIELFGHSHEAWAVQLVKPGFYKTDAPCSLHAKPSQTSAVASTLEAGALVMADSLMIQKGENILWARTSTQHWLPLQKTGDYGTSSKCQMARPMTLGPYFITSHVETTYDKAGLKRKGALPVGKYVNIVDLAFLELAPSASMQTRQPSTPTGRSSLPPIPSHVPTGRSKLPPIPSQASASRAVENEQQEVRMPQGKLRGQAESGLWIDLEMFGPDGISWASPVPLGYYHVKEDSEIFFDADATNVIGQVRAGAYLEVLEVHLGKGSEQLMAKCSAGWLVLVNVGTHHCFAAPYNIGAYCLLADDVPLLPCPDLRSEPQELLQADGYIQVLETSCIRNQLWLRIEGGGWLAAQDQKSGAPVAIALPLGYRKVVLDGTQVTQGYGLNSSVIGSLALGSLVELVQIRATGPVNGFLRGQLAKGGWINLLDSSINAHWAEFMHLGAYKITSTTDVYEEPHLQSSVLGTLTRETYVQVDDMMLCGSVMFAHLVDEDGWIKLECYEDSGSSNKRWAAPVPKGVHETRASGLEVTEDIRTESGLIGDLESGTLLQIHEVAWLASEQQVRGRLADGGWVSLIDAVSGVQFTTPFQPGAYVTWEEEVEVSSRLAVDSSAIRTLEIGTYVQVLDTALVVVTGEDVAVRARLAGGGFLTVMDSDRRRLVRVVPLGAHVVVAEAAAAVATPSLHAQQRSKHSLNYALGTYVHVEEVVLVHTEHVLRARLADDGGFWLTLADARSGFHAAMPVPVGVYRVLKPSCDNVPLLPDEPSDDVVPGEYLEVAEVAFDHHACLVRGRLSTSMTGGMSRWVTLLDGSTGHRRAEALPLGAYKSCITPKLKEMGKEAERFVVMEVRISEDGSGTLQGLDGVDGWRDLEDSSGNCYAREDRFTMFFGTTEDLASKYISAKLIPPAAGGTLGPGVYLSRSKEKALKHGPEVLEVSVNLGRVKRIEKRNHPLQKTWQKHGFDAAWVPPGAEVSTTGMEEDCIHDPSRICVVGLSED